MPNPPVQHSTFVIERTYAKPPERVFAAFSDPAKKQRWFADRGSEPSSAYTLDFRVGGEEHSRYQLGPETPFPGTVMETRATYLRIIDNQLVTFSQAMDFGGRRISAALITFELAPAGAGTKLTLTHHAAFFEGADGEAMRRQGWESLLGNLQKELER